MESSFWGEPSEDKKIWWQLQRHIRSLHLHVSVYTLPMMKIDRFSCQNKRHCMAMEDFWESARAASWPSWIPGWRQGRVSGQTDVFAETLNRSSDDRELSVCFPRSDQISIGVRKGEGLAGWGKKTDVSADLLWEICPSTSHALIMTKHRSNMILGYLHKEATQL